MTGGVTPNPCKPPWRQPSSFARALAAAGFGLLTPARALADDKPPSPPPLDSFATLPGQLQMLWLAVGYTTLALALAFGVTVLVRAWTGKFDVAGLISEPSTTPGKAGKASLSRFQGLLFTFVVATGMVAYIASKQGFDGLHLDNSVLLLLSGSAATYLTGRYLGNNAASGKPSGIDPTIQQGGQQPPGPQSTTTPPPPAAPPPQAGLPDGLGQIVGPGAAAAVQRYADPQNVARDGTASPKIVVATAVAGAGAFGLWTPLAVVIGGATIAVKAQADGSPDGFQGELRTRRPDASRGTSKCFSGADTVVIPADAIAILEARFQAKTATTTQITCTVAATSG